MPSRRSLLLLVPYALLALLIWWFPQCESRTQFPVHARFTDATYPFTPERLRARLARIAPLVSEVVSAPLDIDSLEIVVRDDRVAAEERLRATLAERLDTRHQDFQQPQVSFGHIVLQQAMSGFLAEYLPAKGRIAVQPLGHEILAPDAVESLLDVVLAHELAHVWQDRCFGVFEQEGVASTEESHLARAAIVEGSAEFVARAVARRLGVVHLFDRMTAARNEQAAQGTANGVQLTLARWARWAYGEGLRFVEAAHEAEGEAAWARLFTAMPTDVWSIEHPQAWLAQGEAHVEDLDGWADRLVWLLDAARAPFVHVTGWGHGPALRADVESRLELAGLSANDAPWNGCRGGVVLAGRPGRGPLVGEPFLLHAWRFPTRSDARDARTSLERALEMRGPSSWAGEDAVVGIGSPRVRAGRRGGRAWTSLVFREAPLPAQEGSWALRVEGAILLEVYAWREGIAPALLEILEIAAAARTDAAAIDAARTGETPSPTPYADLVRLRLDGELRGALPVEPVPIPLRNECLARTLAEADGEATVLAWLDAHGTVGAWMTALGPGTGEEDVEELERGPLLAGALASEDDDLVRFALSAIADWRSTLTPHDTGVLEQVAALTAHPDPWIRTVAVLAADALGNEHPLDDERVNTLAEDESPAVRSALAMSPRLQRETTRKVRRELQDDPHPAVRRAAARDATASRDPMDVIVDAVMGTPRDDGETEPDPRADDPTDRTAAARLMWEVMGRIAGDRVDDALLNRIRRLLHSPDEIVRVHALSMVLFLGDERAHFLPELVRTLTEAGLRRLAVQALAKGDLDLASAAASLRRLLEDPHLRPHVLRVLAANDIALEPAELERARGWMNAGDVQLAAAASLLVLSRDTEDPRPLEVLVSTWNRLPEGWREEALGAILTHRPGSEVGRRLLEQAIRSPLFGERSNALRLVKGGGDLEGPNLLLDAMDDAGPVLAEALFTRFLEVAQELDEAEGKQAGLLLARHLEHWCDAGQLPAVDADVLTAWSSPELTGSPELVHALDRCLQLDDPSLLRHALALLRSNLDSDRWPENAAVGAAMERLCSLTGAPNALTSYCADSLLWVYTDRETVEPAAVHAVLRRAARPTRDDDFMGYDVESVLENHPRRVEAALELVPEFIDAGTRNGLATALTVLEAAGPGAREFLPRLRSLTPRLLPTWRRRVERVIEAIDVAEGDE